ncbi:MAG: uracil-DNA glycosylase [Spirochaetes bacterium]|nr:uracil-DNA glycosylase [Spirochaetota bacterium]
MMAQNKAQLLEDLRNNTIGNCTRCKLHATRSTIVFGEGNPEASVMFIGEGPGKDEDAQGRPFVGKAGQLLTAVIEKGMKLKRSDVYIANVVKCRPTVNLELKRDRPPDDEEVAACGPFLKKQIEIINPRVIVTLGNPSTKFLVNPKEGITKVHGVWHLYNNIPVMPTFHPSYILRNGGDTSPLKRLMWEDIKKVIAYLHGEITFEAIFGKSGVTLDISINVAGDEKRDDEVQGSLF